MRERMRSGSVSSSQGSHKGARKPPATNPPPEHASSTDSHGDHESIEEGLFEMQQSVSDLIAPSPPASDAVVSPGPVSAGGRTSSRRSNTSSLSQANGRRTRRTSSSLSGAATGLDINVTDLPSIPSLADSEPGYGVSPTSSSSSTGSIPSLTGANSTASSGLSAIPESPATPVRSSVEKGITDALKEQEQVRRRSKRESVVLGSPRTPRRQSSISTPSSASPPTAHSGNVKMGASPSIGQVLDRVSVSDAEAVPRRLRSK
ncbi:uncharacterized protein C8Q71DRAFT_791337 [Rhodofomes roseus]|uniref:Uncharacterized protein n=1 Tax=Rhodofomes roseus TaxID=34475 RepID=A0ABQ8JYC0_9APHY|nr:uncharacterized protein C8Q71DRAFT_791337 [Rhodofomes roseus]KAH9829262.1 hypothetical protein C8Q71DRAFT_791337 [Rhodofomes roseus]